MNKDQRLPLLPQQREVLAYLTQAGIPWYAVGGAVRDMMAHQPSSGDLDLTTPLAVSEVLKTLQKGPFKLLTHAQDYGTLTLVHNDTHVELTSFRTDVLSTGRHANVAATTSMAVDAARRDFTCNALYQDAQGTIYDPTGLGLRDATRRRVRFIGNPDHRLAEDHLRLLRYIRFQLTFSGQPPYAGYRPYFTRWAPSLQKLSVERRWSELEKILATPMGRQGLGSLWSEHFLWQHWLGYDDSVWQMPWLPSKKTLSFITQPLILLAYITHLSAVPPALAQALTRHQRTSFNAYRLWLQRLTTHKGKIWIRALSLKMAPEDAHQILRLAFIHKPRHQKAKMRCLEAAYAKPFTATGHDMMQRYTLAPGPAITQALETARKAWLHGG